MDTVLELLSQLRRAGVRIWAVGNELRCSGPLEAIAPNVLEELRARKASIVELLRDSPAASVAGTVPISRIPHVGERPLSFAQQRLWFIDELEPDSSLYTIPLALRLVGPLDVAILARCLSEVVRRHEVLRTTFSNLVGQPEQRIGPALPVTLPVADLSGLPAAERERETGRLLAEESRRPFDLSHDLMLRAGLLRLDALSQEHIFWLTFHHIAADGWSLAIVRRELSALYATFSQGQPSPLAELPIQYADFAAWQREWLQGDVLAAQLAYWKRQLDGAPAVLELPADHPRPAMQTYRGAEERVVFDKELLKVLEQLSRQEGATLFMTLLAAFQTLLFRYSEQEDVVVGTPIAGRNRLETEELIGVFVNTLVLRTDLSGNPTFRELLGRVREVTLAAYEHQDLPFEKLVEELNPERNLGHAPLFQVMFGLQNIPAESLRLPGITASRVIGEIETAKFDLTCLLAVDGEKLIACLNYNRDLFEPETIQRMAGHFQTLLKAAAAEPDRHIAELTLLTATERQQLLVDWNRTEVAYPKDRCLHELIEQQVERAPEAVAVVYQDTRLTYRQLNERANQLARHLRKLGVGPDVLVGICAERSLEMVVGLLGILKAGGAYVPLDPEYPQERLKFMLEDAGVGVLLTQARLVEAIGRCPARIIRLDADWPRIAAESTAHLKRSAQSQHLAYLIYTSGSTGRPKGAMNTHAGIVNRLLWMQDAYPLTAADHILQKTPFSFDVSVWEFFWPLLSGARLVMARPGGHRDTAYLAEIIRREAITTLHFVPSMLSAFLEQDGLESACRGVQRVICSGEALPWETQERFFARLSAELHNLYGPTESAVDVTSWACQRDYRLRTVPIGRPIANTQLYILDQRLQPLPIGVAGEVHIGGVGLARGYHQRPELTAEKFISNPFRSDPAARLYKTGDLARYLPDGNIEYLGRLDHQVKIRGFRIELGEIETVFMQHPAVQTAAVVAREDTPGEKRLTAYLVSRNGALGAAELRAFLGTKLPDYMVPSAFVALDALPLSPNGKVDRKALPAPARGEPDFEQAFVAPRTPVEVALARIWAETLGLERVSVHDNFFHLGGHSLLAARMLAKAQKTLKKRVPLATVFRAPTIAALAQHFQSEQKNAWDLLEPIRPTGSGAVVVGFGGLLIEHLAELVPPAHPLYWCKPEHFDGARTRYSTVEALAAHYCDQIAAAGLAGPYVLCGFSYGGLVAFETARQLYERDRATSLLFLVEPTRAGPDKKAPGLRTVHHLRSLPAVPRGQRAAYLYAKARASVQLVRRRIRQLYCSARLACGLSVPVNMRWPHVEDQYRKAAQQYVPRPFSGRLVLIHGARYPAEAIARWATLCLDGISVNCIQLTDHLHLVRDKQWVANWADLLRLHLSRLADSRNSDTAVSVGAAQGSIEPAPLPETESAL